MESTETLFAITLLQDLSTQESASEQNARPTQAKNWLSTYNLSTKHTDIMIYKGVEIPDNLKDKVIDHIVEECTDQFIDILTDAYLHDYRDWLNGRK